MNDLIIAMLWSISPFGEAKVGIPYGLLNGTNIWATFIACLIANILIFPVMNFFLDFLNRHFLKLRFYKKSALFVARRAKKGAGKKIQTYGFWGLLFFVMLPVPGTGVYAGTIAAFVLRVERKKAFWANAIGIFLSCVIVWSTTILTMNNF